MKGSKTVLLGILVLVVISSAQAATIHVPSEQATIQAGIDEAVNGDTVLVSDGEYTGLGNVNMDFHGKAIIVKSKNGAENCIIDCGGAACGFYFDNGEGLDSVVDGFTIRNGAAAEGGAISCWNSSSPTISNNIITGNQASNRGGGINCAENSSPTIINNVIAENWCDFDAGGIACWNSSPTISNNIITGNWAEFGGGIVCHNDSNATISNNIITGNSAIHNGGAIYCYDSSPAIINNTITENSVVSDAGGGIDCGASSSITSITITNTILWNNDPQEIVFFMDPDITVTISYSDIQGGKDGIVTNNSGTVNWGVGNIDEDPLFVNATNDDYHLQAGSPCIDAGTANGAPTYDIEGNPRDDFPDMGAYEGTGAMNQPPVADAGPDQSVEANTMEGANVQLDGSSSSDPDGDDLDYYWTWDSASATGESPEIFLPLGSTIVTLVINDGTVDSEPSEVNITVADTTPPELTCPSDITVEQESYAGTVVSLAAIATDICDPDVEITSDELDVYPLGATTITFTAIDDSGNSSIGKTVITVVDTTPPQITLDEPSPSILWPANHKFIDVIITGIAFDICDAELDIDVSAKVIDTGDGDLSLEYETDYEIVRMSIDKDGNIEIAVSLRAEASAKGKGRIYKITATVTDDSENSNNDTVKVLVPHDKGKGKKK